MAIIVVIQDVAEVDALVGWGWQLALAGHEGLCILHIFDGVALDPVDLDDAALDAATDPTLAAIAAATADGRRASRGPDTSSIIVRSVRTPRAIAVVEAEVRRVEPSLLMIAGRWRGEQRPLARQVLDQIHCTVLTVAGGATAAPRRVLVPTAGGPHAARALQLAAAVAQQTQGEACALYVEPPTMHDGEAVGRHILERVVRDAGLAPSAHLSTRVELDSSPREGIARVAAEYDAILIGASNQGFVYRLLFGSLPQAVTEVIDGHLVGVLRRATPWDHRLRHALHNLVTLWVPQMERDQRVELYDRLQTGSRWGFDFMALIALSTSIAALGLVQSSTAVVIGAMLVAPLMTPLLGAGLALVQGNRVLLEDAVRAVVLGFLLALVIGVLVGLASPVKVLTVEMAARGGPNLLDLGVALLSGVAAAYASARPHLIAALPGVAIAAALVPPIATVGLSIAFGEFAVARGAALLFVTNVIAIVLGAALALWLTGVRGSGARLWARRVIVVMALGLVGLTIPLGVFLLDVTGRMPPNLTDEIRTVADDNGYRFLHVERRGDAMEVHLQGPGQPATLFVQQLREVAWERFGEPVPVRIVTELVVEAR